MASSSSMPGHDVTPAHHVTTGSAGWSFTAVVGVIHINNVVVDGLKRIGQWRQKVVGQAVEE